MTPLYNYHKLDTKGAQLGMVFLPFMRTNIGQQSNYFAAAKVWNSIVKELNTKTDACIVQCKQEQSKWMQNLSPTSLKRIISTHLMLQY